MSIQRLCALHARSTSNMAAGGWCVMSVHLHKKEKVLEVAFDDGVTRCFSAELLRCLSPSADNAASPKRGGSTLVAVAPQGATAGRTKVVAGRRHVGIMALEPLGHYAIRVRFDDLHDGIWPYDLLRELGEHRLSWARNYIRFLRHAGMSRDPQTQGTKAVKGRGGGTT